jgi:ATP-binding cassette subfamily B protein
MWNRRFVEYLRSHRQAYLTGYAASLGSIAMAQLAPWVLRAAIDAIRPGGPADRLPTLALLLLAVAVAEASLNYQMRLRILGASLRIDTELRRDYFRHLQRMPLAFYQDTRIGDLMARATNDIRAVQRFAGVGLMRSVHTLVMVAASIAFMLAISRPLTVSMLLILPLVSLLFLLMGRRIRERFDDVQERFSSLSARAQENFSGIRVVKAFAQEDAETEAFRVENDGVVRSNLALARIQGALWPAISLILGVASMVLLYQGGGEVMAGRLTVGQLVQFSYYLARLSFPMVALGWVLNLWQQGRASMARLDEIFSAPPRIADPADPVELREPRGEIEFRDVSFAYGVRTVLDRFSLRIPAGATVAIVGPTGSGKSTLAQLIPRLYDATSGQVLLDGRDVRRYSLASLRRAIGYVPQETFLFSETLWENIALGADAGQPDRVSEAARVSRLARDVEDFPHGYETILGERGVTLSGGQKQRTAIARALARDPKIVILDDALSSVDTVTEDEILRGLRSALASRTSLLISHRISTIQNADLIVVLENGRIAEQGTHAELLARGGTYAEMYERQLLRDALEASLDETPNGSEAPEPVP